MKKILSALAWVRRVAFITAVLLWPITALAQSSSACPVTAWFAYGYTPTPVQWQACFNSKQNFLGYTPLNKAGDTMFGELVTGAPTTASSGFNLPPGSAPSSPVNGDLWSTSGGLYYQSGGTTYGPINAGTTAANPTATAGPTAVNGSASTFMRSDAAPAVQKATASQFGIVEPDASTITGSGGVLSAASTTILGTTCTPGSSCISKGQVPGTATNDSASSGNVGEYVNSTISNGSPVSLTTLTAANVTSISLTAGDWDVWGSVIFTGASSTNVTGSLQASIGTSSATISQPVGYSNVYAVSSNTFQTDGAITAQITPVRLSLSTTTTVYLVAEATFNTSTASAYGFITARRAR